MNFIDKGLVHHARALKVYYLSGHDGVATYQFADKQRAACDEGESVGHGQDSMSLPRLNVVPRRRNVRMVVSGVRVRTSEILSI